MIKAWLVSDEFEGVGTVVFHSHGLAARREGAQDLDLDFEDVVCKRAKEFDCYVGRDGPTPRDLIFEHGWFWRCSECDKNIYAEDYPVIDGDFVYCGGKCFSQPKSWRAP